MAFDTYLKFDDGAKIKGESTSKGMEGTIEIFSFSFGASNPTTVGSGSTGLTGGRVSISSFNFMKKCDKSSTALFQACCGGTHIDSATVTLRKAGGDAGQQPFLVYTFTDVMIESVQWSGSTGGDDTPTESVSLAFGKIQIDYSTQDDKGKMSKAGNATWDLTKVSK